MGDPREDKLPKWAQEELKYLRRVIVDLNEDLDVYTNAVSRQHADTFVRRAGTRKDLPLGAGMGVIFAGKERYDRFSVRIENGTLYVLGDDEISIVPRSSNLVEIVHNRTRKG